MKLRALLCLLALALPLSAGCPDDESDGTNAAADGGSENSPTDKGDASDGNGSGTNDERRDGGDGTAAADGGDGKLEGDASADTRDAAGETTDETDAATADIAAALTGTWNFSTSDGSCGFSWAVGAVATPNTSDTNTFTLTLNWESYGWTPVLACTADPSDDTFTCTDAANGGDIGPCTVNGGFTKISGTFDLGADPVRVTIQADTGRTAAGDPSCSSYNCASGTAKGENGTVTQPAKEATK
jgi:hypothetical protein